MRMLDTEAAEFFAARDELGEGPAWHSAKGELLWVDIIRGRLYASNIEAGIPSVSEYGRPVSAALPRAAGGTVVAIDDGLILLDADGRLEHHIPVEPDVLTNRLGDMSVDPVGRLWLDTLDKDLTAGRGGLYRLSPGEKPVKIIDQTCIANGIGWSPDGTLMYFVDSATGRIDVLDYDARDGSVSHRRPWASIDQADGSPDGLAVDSLGGVWVAVWGGGQVRRYAPDGELDVILPLPVRNVSSCCFAGPDLDHLFITTGRVELSESMLRAEPMAGSVFRAVTGFRGLAMPPFAG